MVTTMTRRGAIAGVLSTAYTVPSTAAAPQPAADAKDPKEPFGYCLNTSTVRLPEGLWGKSRPVVELIDVAAKAGYQAIEPWVSELNEYVKTGGSVKDLGKRIADAGLVVPDVIAFAEWVVAD